MQVIKAENVSKKYYLGSIGGGTLTADINRWLAKIRNKPDPLLKIGQEQWGNETLMALNNINFEVNSGEAIGIIGKNGAGKSTLLKILSRITTPTTGTVKIKGRIAALLEVGTGFHPELTGKENIFLNGAILGMSKKEISSKLDEIIDFSGVEKFIDTPVKRYSSGMRVRLAFAVAAHLNPEILIIDEVLAVGDAEFQKKCLGKMESVSKNEGRTVLFVSHQLGMVKTLCTRAILLEKGTIKLNGNTEEVISHYLNSDLEGIETKPFVEFKPDDKLPAQILNAEIKNQNGESTLSFDVFDKISIDLQYIIRKPIEGMGCVLTVERNGEILFNSFDTDRHPERLNTQLPGIYNTEVTLPSPLKAGLYNIHVKISKLNAGTIASESNVFRFHIEERSFDPSLKSFAQHRKGTMVADLEWKLNKFIPS